MQYEQNKLIVISGCSGGGKSTLITELSKKGYAVAHEVATDIVREQLAVNGDKTPWKNPNAFCELLIARSIEDFYRAKAMATVLGGLIFFDRSYLEGIRYYKTLNTINTYAEKIKELSTFSEKSEPKKGGLLKLFAPTHQEPSVLTTTEVAERAGVKLAGS